MIKSIEDISIDDEYQKSLVEDYCNFIKQLYGLIVTKIGKTVDNNTINIVNLYKKDKIEYNMLEELKKIRMHDFFQKGIFENLANKLKEKLTDEDLEISFDMTRSMGLLDIKMQYNDNIKIGIQIQGNSYRKFVEGSNKDKVVDLALSFDKKGLFKGMKPEEVNENLEQYSDKLKFNKYDSSKILFLYKYEKLKNISNEDLIKKIVTDDILKK